MDSHACMHFGKRKEKREHAQQPPSLNARLDTPNSWKEKKKKNEHIFFLHENTQCLSGTEIDSDQQSTLIGQR